MSNKYKILELLKQNELTVKEIADKTDFNENEVRVYIHRLLKDNLIEEIGKKNRYCIYAAIKTIPEETSDNKELLGIIKIYNLLFAKITRNHKILDSIEKADNSIIEFIENHEEFTKALELVK